VGPTATATITSDVCLGFADDGRFRFTEVVPVKVALTAYRESLKLTVTVIWMGTGSPLSRVGV
jgi:hypothetical protein